MWWVHDRLDYSALADRRLVLEFRFTDQRDRFWIVQDAQGPSVCNADPGFGVDATVRSDLRTLYQVWLGKRNLREALRSGELEIDGTPAVARRLPKALSSAPSHRSWRPRAVPDTTRRSR